MEEVDSVRLITSDGVRGGEKRIAIPGYLGVYLEES